MSSNLSVFNLLKIITEIKTNPHQTPEELYSTFSISKSGFYKYKNRLEEEMDFVFHYDRGQKCFVIDNEPFIPTINLSLGELSALVMSMGQFYASGGDYIITYRALKAVQKLVANCCPEKKIRRQLEEMFDETLYNRGYGCKEDILSVIEKAWESRQILRIHYFSYSDGMREVVHDVEPYMIFFKRRALYMDAHCRKFKDIRMYRLNRIRKAEILPQTGYEIREDYSFKKRHQHAFSIFTGGSPQTVRIRFNQRKALFIEEVLWHPSQKITPDPNHPGSIIFEVTVSYPKEVIWWMRHWGSDAEVLEPQEMRDYMLEMARKEVEMYNK
jgi:predicted DNA-binding transcriptional regulator YafY